MSSDRAASLIYDLSKVKKEKAVSCAALTHPPEDWFTCIQGLPDFVFHAHLSRVDLQKGCPCIACISTSLTSTPLRKRYNSLIATAKNEMQTLTYTVHAAEQ